MALGSKSLHCTLLLLHLIMMAVGLSVLVVSSLSLAELIDKRPFVEGKYESKPNVKNDAEVLQPERVIGNPEEKESDTAVKATAQGTLTGPAILLVAVATATLLLSAFAFYSTLQRNIHFLRLFIALMALVLAAQVSSGIWALVARSRCIASIRVSLINQMDEYEVGTSGGVVTTKGRAPRGKSPATSLWTHPWDALQWQMKCCGIEGPDDYFGRGAIPLSCCAPANASVKEELDRPQESQTTPGFSCHTIRRNGCLDSLDGYVRLRLLWVGIIAITATFVEEVPLMLTVAYSMSIRRDQRKIYQ